MARYHFNIIDGDNLIPDTEGRELPDLEAARFEARCSARDLAIRELQSEGEVDGRQIEITDEHGLIIETMMVRDVLIDFQN